MGGLVARLLEHDLPQSLRHVPLIEAVLVGEQRILLRILGSVPLDDVLAQVAVHILDSLLIIDGGGHAF